MPSIHPFIHFNGNADDAFTFYKSVFGTEFSKCMRYREISSEAFPISEVDANRIMHVVLPIGGNSKLVGSDTMEAMGNVTENDNRNSIFISADSRDEADKLFNALAEGGQVEMPISDGPLGSYFGMLSDKYNVQWMIEYTA